MEGNSEEGKALLRVWSAILISLSYSYFVSSRLPKNKLRLLSLLPNLILHTLLPLSLSSTLPTGITVFFITWLANSKLILFSFDLGPLSSARSLSTFILIAVFPVKIIPNPNPKPKILPLNQWSKAFIFASLVTFCDRYKDAAFPQSVFLLIYCSMLYLFIDLVLGLSNAFVGSIIGVELEKPSDEPYAASSLQDFWGRRWNLMVTDTLRLTVYLPVKRVLRDVLGETWAVLSGVVASFLVSGIIHEVIFFYMTRAKPTWEVTWYFVLHGLCVVVEVALKLAYGPRVRLHWALTGPLTIGFVIWTGSWWFFPPLVRNQADVKAIQELKSLYHFVKPMFKWLSI